MNQQTIFKNVHDCISEAQQNDEVILANFEGEISEFARLNHNKIRQLGQVEQMYLSIELIVGQRHSGMRLSLSADDAFNRGLILEALESLRQQLPLCIDDPYLSYSTEPYRSEDIRDANVPETKHALQQLQAEAGAVDLVGIWASGFMYRGFCNSLGQSNWFAQQNAHCDWSLYHQADKAVKCSYAASHWDTAAFSQAIQKGLSELSYVKRPAKTIAAASYRCYLSPSALNEILGIISWRGFGYKMQHTKQSSLQLLVNGERSLHPQVTISEDTEHGLGPVFTDSGFKIPGSVPLIKAGKHSGALCNARSAAEYKQTMNSDGEYPSSLVMEAGDLKQSDVLAQLDTGIYINDLWYLNYSDPMAGQITGMTRFACFWVENGEIVAPINVMRFDDSIFNLLGDELEAISDCSMHLPDASSYAQRSTRSACLPGVLVKNMRFTL